MERKRELVDPLQGAREGEKQNKKERQTIYVRKAYPSIAHVLSQLEIVIQNSCTLERRDSLGSEKISTSSGIHPCCASRSMIDTPLILAASPEHRQWMNTDAHALKGKFIVPLVPLVHTEIMNEKIPGWQGGVG
jgi:hypothetical protein